MENNKEVKYGCFAEEEDADTCVMDNNNNFNLSDCSMAVELHSQGKTKEDCEYWRPIPYVTAGEITCPMCGYTIANPSEELIERARQLIKDLIKFVGEEK